MTSALAGPLCPARAGVTRSVLDLDVQPLEAGVRNGHRRHPPGDRSSSGRRRRIRHALGEDARPTEPDDLTRSPASGSAGRTGQCQSARTPRDPRASPGHRSDPGVSPMGTTKPPPRLLRSGAHPSDSAGRSRRPPPTRPLAPGTVATLDRDLAKERPALPGRQTAVVHGHVRADGIHWGSELPGEVGAALTSSLPALYPRGNPALHTP